MSRSDLWLRRAIAVFATVCLTIIVYGQYCRHAPIASSAPRRFLPDGDIRHLEPPQSGKVVPVGFNAPLMAAAMNVVGAISTPGIDFIETGNLKFSVPAIEQVGIRVIDGSFIVHVATNGSGDPAQYILKNEADGTDLATTDSQTTNDRTIIAPAISPGIYNLAVYRSLSGIPTKLGPTLRIIVPAPTSRQPTTITRASGLKYTDNGTPVDAPTQFTVFGANGLARLGGNFLFSDQRLDVLFFDANKKVTRVVRPEITYEPSTNGRWSAEFSLPNGSTKFVIRTVSNDGSGHFYGATEMTASVDTSLSSLTTKPTLAIEETTLIDGVIHLGKAAPVVTVTPAGFTGADANIDVVLVIDDMVVASGASPDRTKIQAPSIAADGRIHTWRVDVMQGNLKLISSDDLKVKRLGGSFTVSRVEPVNFGSGPGFTQITVTFDPDHPVKEATAAAFVLHKTGGSGIFSSPTTVTTNAPILVRGQNAVLLTLPAAAEVDLYRLTVLGTLKDVFGNLLIGTSGVAGTDFVYEFKNVSTVAKSQAVTSPGINDPAAPVIEFPEFTNPRKPTNGFNPSDKVETRVARLYYYRDAHRVAQIINRDVKSYNRAAVTVQQQEAEKARKTADTATNERRFKESAAIQLAQNTRDAENDLRNEEAALVDYRQKEAAVISRLTAIERELPTVKDSADKTKLLMDERTALNTSLNELASIIATQGSRTQSAAQRVQTERQKEVSARNEMEQAQAAEAQLRDEQFRREVAAAQADPDTFAAGKPESDDPVRQVSIAVIGEGLIQLRGPIKGINIIREMINQIDSPVGQVRVGVHTVQVNGEHEDRMEVVSQRIQTYIDHSRFLTVQSAEMLRKATVKVASRRAAEAAEQYPGPKQCDRDVKYMYSFFGRDFVNELAAMDSEFLRSGNKLLSLHSMDSTSLCSALFIIALANNSTRREIIDEFEQMCAEELPAAEQAYLEAGMTCNCRNRGRCRHQDAFCLMAGAARFRSFRGFFDAEVVGDDGTMTPVQREFIRLAQIFKSRLVTELELNQRVMERSLIEEREVTGRLELLKQAYEAEQMANREVERVAGIRREAQKTVLAEVQKMVAEFRAVWAQVDDLKIKLRDASKSTGNSLSQVASQMLGSETWPDELAPVVRRIVQEESQRQPEPNETLAERLLQFRNRVYEAINKYSQKKNGNDAPILPLSKSLEFDLKSPGGRSTSADAQGKLTFDDTSEREATVALNALKPLFVEALKTARSYHLTDENKERADAIQQRYEFIVAVTGQPLAAADQVFRLRALAPFVIDMLKDVSAGATPVGFELEKLVAGLTDYNFDSRKVYQEWLVLRQNVRVLASGTVNDVAVRLEPIVRTIDGAFETMMRSALDHQFAQEVADKKRRPLDHKKFLDMLIDDLEDKYIELLEGTRAHTAVVDDYIKRLATALDDDFNTQFYFPAFREVRKASTTWDVNLGQVETTTILANNRMFAKVSPQATMEFDLPRRDIMIKEAMDGAMAAVQDYGALVNDPAFMALTKMGAGQPTSSGVNSTGGFSTVRNVLPSLPSGSAEKVLSQAGPGGGGFGTALDALIPDPAIYKFETGTGFEIRPTIQPDGQSVVFHFNYMYSTNVREPVNPNEKHLGRVKQHFIDTDVQTGNYELREVSRYQVALKASRTARGVPLLQDIPGVGVLFRPLPSAESSLQQNIILAQSVIFPTLFDLMGLRWAPAVADLDPLRLSNEDFLVRSRRQYLMNRVYDHSSGQVDQFLRIPEGERRGDLYRSQETIPNVHPNGYEGSGLNYRESGLQEGYEVRNGGRTGSGFVPAADSEGSPFAPKPPQWPFNQPSSSATVPFSNSPLSSRSGVTPSTSSSMPLIPNPNLVEEPLVVSPAPMPRTPGFPNSGTAQQPAPESIPLVPQGEEELPAPLPPLPILQGASGKTP